MDLHFDPLQYRYPSRRRLVYGRRGMVCASQPLAAQAGLDMIKKGGNAFDAALAAARGISTFPLPVPDRETRQKDIEDMLCWYALQPETPHWLAFGTPEHALLDGEGRQFRVDLLVDDGRELVAVEYKTGTPGALPDPGHREQLSRYLRLLQEAGGMKVRGALVYLDRREIFQILPGDDHEQP